MIGKNNELQKFENEFIRKEKTDIMENFRIIEHMYYEAVALGVFPRKEKLEGLEIDIKIARVVNNVSGSVKKNSS